MSTSAAALAALVEAGSVPGASLTVWRDGDVVEDWHVGEYRDEGGAMHPLHGGVAHPLYSTSKGLSGTVLERVLPLDDRVCDWLPSYRGEGKDRTLVRHLLCHAAGFTGESGWPDPAFDPYGPETWAELVEWLCEQPLQWESGSRAVYHSASGQALAWAVAERVTGRTAAELFCEEYGDTISLRPRAGEETAHVFDHDPHRLGQPAWSTFGRTNDVCEVLDGLLARGYRPAPWIAGWGPGWFVVGMEGTEAAARGFGFGDRCSTGAFGHPGGNHVVAIADPAARIAMCFITTAPLPPDTDLAAFRCAVSEAVLGQWAR